MPRFLKVQGLPGVLVPRPGVAGRWAGKAPKPLPPDHKPDPADGPLDLLNDVVEALPDDDALRKAARAGHIQILAVGVGKSLDSVAWEEKV